MSLVKYEKKGKIVHITLNNPDKRNRLSTELVTDLGKAWVNFRDDDDALVAILRGEGNSFCAGADLSTSNRRVVIDPAARPSSLFANSLTFNASPLRYEIWKPVIAALNGYVIGGGFWLALTCDIRIAAADTLLGLPEPKMNMGTIFAGLLPRYVPLSVASELLLIGDMINAQRAYEAFIVNKVVPNEQLLPTAITVAERLCENGMPAVKAIKEALLKGMDTGYLGTLWLSEYIFNPLRGQRQPKFEKH